MFVDLLVTNVHKIWLTLMKSGTILSTLFNRTVNKKIDRLQNIRDEESQGPFFCNLGVTVMHLFQILSAGGNTTWVEPSQATPGW